MVRFLTIAVLLLSAPSLATSPSADMTAACSHLEFKVAHHFARGAARERVMQLLTYWKERFGVTATWSGDHVLMSGQVFGIEILAALDITDSDVVGVASDPGIFWRSQAHSYVEQKLKKYLSPTYDEP